MLVGGETAEMPGTYNVCYKPEKSNILLETFSFPLGKRKLVGVSDIFLFFIFFPLVLLRFSLLILFLIGVVFVDIIVVEFICGYYI